MEAECLCRSPEAPNTIDLLRESLTDPNRPKLPRECKNTCRVFLKWSQLTHKSSQTLCLIIQFELQLGPQVPSLPGATETSGVLYPTGNALFKAGKNIFSAILFTRDTALFHSFIQINIPNILLHSTGRKSSWKDTGIFLGQRVFFTPTSCAGR